MIFRPIKQKKISEEIVEQIEHYIKDGILKPNEKNSFRERFSKNV
jgi:GntR family transcriptional repressor for pyruvate dehydrogenase complex